MPDNEHEPDLIVGKDKELVRDVWIFVIFLLFMGLVTFILFGG